MTDTNEDIYTELAEEFNEKMGINDPSNDYWEEWRIRTMIIAEEVGELVEAVNKGKEDKLNEELTDIVITCFTAANTMNVDLREEYMEKMEYNLKKSGKTKSGKVVDDAEENK